jgi:hypothetical protein
LYLFFQLNHLVPDPALGIHPGLIRVLVPRSPQ